MTYLDVHGQLEPNESPWTCVAIPGNASLEIPGNWCTTYKSAGRYYRRKEFNGVLWGSYWYFEKSEDATLFALNCL